MALTSFVPPVAVRRGEYVFTSMLKGSNPDGSFDPSGEVQLRRAWEKLPDAIASAGATLDDVVSVGVHVADHALRPHISAKWVELFPDAKNRPARRTTAMKMPAGELAHIQAVAVVGGGRKNFEVPGVPHKDPLPGGAMVGKLLVSSAVNGQVPNGALREGVAAQIDQAYLNVQTLLKQAGATLDDIVHFWVFMKEEFDIDTLVEKWCGVFPTDGDRPARKTFLRSDIQGDQWVQMQFTALVGGGKRRNIEVPGVHHRDPIPMAARIGKLFMSSGVPGVKPDPDEHTPGGKPADTLDEQLLYAFGNLETLMKDQGGTLANVAHLGALIASYDVVPALFDAIAQRWPANPPAVQLWGMPVPSPTMKVQLYGTAVF
jgi:2-iminobutanoate/2-iminopropanoate deaminase